MSQSCKLDWNAINGFKNLINKDNHYDPYMVGRIQKFLLEICNRDECRSIFSTIFFNAANSNGLPIQSCNFSGTYFEIKSDIQNILFLHSNTHTFKFNSFKI